MTTTLPRAATSSELALIRTDNQSHDLYLSIITPATVYTARLAAVPASTDRVASITYTSGSGTLANVLADMTLLVGSTALGYDIGIARIRKDGATLTGTFYIGEESEIDWSTVVSGGIYLTVVDDFDLWGRHINMAPDGTTPLMDYDRSLSAGADNENTATGAIPTPIMGPYFRVLWLRGTTVSITIYDLASSWVIDGTITSYLSACAGASATSGLNTSTPTFTFNAVGTYRWQTTVTASNGKTYTGYRYIRVETEATCTTQFELSSPPSGDYSSGGWSFGVTLYDEATLALVRDRAMVILHSVDYYGNTRGGVGYNTGSENIWCIGRIAKDTIKRGTDDAYSTVTFEVQGPQFWFGQMTAFPEGVIDVPTESNINKWTKFSNLRLDDLLYHAGMFRTTATRCMDVYPSGDTVRVKRLEEPSESIWDQWVNTFWNARRARPCCDRWGRMFLQIDQQLLLSRTAVPTVMAITTDDWHESIDFDREIVSESGRVDLSGTSWDGATVTAQFALAPGHVFKKFGSVLAQDRLALDGVQANTNTLAGLISAVKNNPYKKIDIKFASSHGLLDIAPHMRATLAISAADSPRGITESLTLIPRGITVVAGNEPGVYYQTVTFEAEVAAALTVTGDTPTEAPTPPTTPYTPPVAIPPISPGLPSDASEVWFAPNNAIYWSGDYFTGGQPTFNKITTLPAGTPLWFGILADGTRAYIMTATKLYMTLTPKTPSWSVIAEVGTIAAGRAIATYFNYTLGPAVIKGSTLYTIACTGKDGANTLFAYGQYSGGVWTWKQSPHGYNTFAPDSLGPDHYSLSGDVLLGSDNSLLENTSGVIGYENWKSTIGNRYVFRMVVSGITGILYVHLIGGADLVNLGESAFTSDLSLSHVSGPIIGNQVQIVSNNKGATGHLWLSSDGTTFLDVATWLPGRAFDTKSSGGGSLFWVPNTIAASNVVSRLYSRAGAVIPDTSGNGDRTGNFWSLTSGPQVIIGAGLVFK